jgi:hypothetical protein
VKLSKALGRECNDHSVSQYCIYRRLTLLVPVSKAYTHLAWQVTADASVFVSTFRVLPNTCLTCHLVTATTHSVHFDTPLKASALRRYSL